MDDFNKALQSFAEKFQKNLVDEGWQVYLKESHVVETLQKEGYSYEVCQKVCHWLEKASMSGNLLESLSMISETFIKARVIHPLEASTVSEPILHKLQSLYIRGIISYQCFEIVIGALSSMHLDAATDEYKVNKHQKLFVEEVFKHIQPKWLSQVLLKFFSEIEKNDINLPFNLQN